MSAFEFGSPQSSPRVPALPVLRSGCEHIDTLVGTAATARLDEGPPASQGDGDEPPINASTDTLQTQLDCPLAARVASGPDERMLAERPIG